MGIADLEHAAAPGWRAPEEAWLGEWLLRAAEGFTGRANSALAAGDPGMPVADAVGLVGRWYAARGRPAMIAVPYPAGRPERSELDQFLARLGWTVRADAAIVMTAATAGIARHARTAAVAIDQAPDAAWLGQYHYRGQQLPPIAIRLLNSAPWQAFASIRAGGETIAIGRVAASGEWAGLTAIEVDPGHRRRGLGTAVTAALAALAADHGFPNLYLQVTDGNAAARSLYHQLGFADHHGYHYRLAPA
jgi:N-acetylglutamate synthase